MSAVKAAFFVKNLPWWERTARIGVALASVALAFAFIPAALGRGLVLAAAAGFAATGLIGFCPACAMVGRRPVASDTREL